MITKKIMSEGILEGIPEKKIDLDEKPTRELI